MSERCVCSTGYTGCFHLFCKTRRGREIEQKKKYKTYLPTYTSGAQRTLVHETYTEAILGSKRQQGSKCELYLSALIKAFSVYLCAYMHMYKSARVNFALLGVWISVLVYICFWQRTLNVHAGGVL